MSFEEFLAQGESLIYNFLEHFQVKNGNCELGKALHKATNTIVYFKIINKKIVDTIRTDKDIPLETVYKGMENGKKHLLKAFE